MKLITPKYNKIKSIVTIISRVSKRTMHTTRNIANKGVNMNLIRHTNSVGALGNNTNTALTNPTNLKNIQRNFPGQGYRAGNYHEDARTATGKELPKHEKSHTNIIDNETNKNVAILSSCKKIHKGCKFIATENVKGDVLPNGKPKEQWGITFEKPRCHDENIFVEDNKATEFVTKHKKNIDDMLNNTNAHTNAPHKRVHKDSPELYHENGQPIFDKHGKEIEYV